MIVLSGKKENETFYCFILVSLLFFLLSPIIWMGFLPTLLHLLNKQLFISFRKAFRALINTFLSAIITYHIFIAQPIVFH